MRQYGRANILFVPYPFLFDKEGMFLVIDTKWLLHVWISRTKFF